MFKRFYEIFSILTSPLERELFDIPNKEYETDISKKRSLLYSDEGQIMQIVHTSYRPK